MPCINGTTLPSPKECKIAELRAAYFLKYSVFSLVKEFSRVKKVLVLKIKLFQVSTSKRLHLTRRIRISHEA